jgi:hypothetical protein
MKKLNITTFLCLVALATTGFSDAVIYNNDSNDQVVLHYRVCHILSPSSGDQYDCGDSQETQPINPKNIINLTSELKEKTNFLSLDAVDVITQGSSYSFEFDQINYASSRVNISICNIYYLNPQNQAIIIPFDTMKRAFCIAGAG